MFTIMGIILIVGLCMWVGILAVEFAFFFSIGLAVCCFLPVPRPQRKADTKGVSDVRQQ